MKVGLRLTIITSSSYYNEPVLGQLTKPSAKVSSSDVVPKRDRYLGHVEVWCARCQGS